jgi:tRNA(Ile)-lysidine synthase
MALLHVLLNLSLGPDWRLVVAHLDHGLRRESAEEARFVARLAGDLGLPVVVKTADVRALSLWEGVSIEEAGRRARYAFFEEVRRSAGAAVIATGHHQDDEIETFFLRLFRGSSLAGLGGIPPKRGYVVRPLIEARRADILHFLKQHEIPFVVDQTNLESGTDRNFVRNRLLPLIRERFPHFEAPLERTLTLVAQEEEFLDAEAKRLSGELVTPTDHGLELDAARARKSPRAMVSRVILLCLLRLSEAGAGAEPFVQESGAGDAKIGDMGPHRAVAAYDSEIFSAAARRWSRVHVDAVVKLIGGDNPSASLDLPGGVTVRREYDRIIMEAGPTETRRHIEPISVDGPGVVAIPAAGMALSFRVVSDKGALPMVIDGRTRAVFDADAVPFPILIRSPRPGDRFRPWGMEGTRRLKKVLIDLKAPVRVRGATPLVVKDDRILWIPGIRRSREAPILPETRLVLEVAIWKPSN